MKALQGLAILLLLQAAGEGIAHATGVPFPGPVLGLIGLLVVLQWTPLREPVAAAADLLLGHLSLLFVPVGVGVITHLDVVANQGLQLLVALVVSTWVGLAVTAAVLGALLRGDAPNEQLRKEPGHE